MKTTIKNMRQAITVMSYCLLATGFAACSPDSFDGADPNGRPTVDGVDFQITVDQETNQMVATYKAQPGLYPIWILDGTSYSTLPEVGYKNDEAGTHTIEMKLGNRNGFSHGSIKKTYTFNETKIDYSSDFRRIADKEWRIANKEAGHMGCGPAGTAGTEWWSAAADDKKAFGVYDDRIVFTATTKKGGSYTYNPGADGMTYVNVGTQWGAGADADIDVALGEQTAAWNFEELDWTDAEGNVSKQRFIRLSANTLFPYISSDDQYADPLFRVEQLTAKKLVLVYDKPDRSIAWRFILTCEADERFVNEDGFDANSDFNMWKGITPTMEFWYAPGWSQIADPGFVDAGNDYTITLPEATSDQWQAQVKFHTNLTTNAATNYDFSAIFNSNKDLNGATVKLVLDGDDGVFYFTDRIDLKAGQDYVFWKSDMPGLDMSKVMLVLDFGGCDAGTTVNVNSIVLKDHANDDGTKIPEEGGDTPTMDWDATSSANLWKAVEDGSALKGIDTWFADNGWATLPTQPEIKHANGVWELDIPQGIGGSQWQGQVKIFTTIGASQSKKYNFYCVVESDQNIDNATIKLTQSDVSENEKHDDNFFFGDRHNITADVPFIYKAEAVVLPKGDAHELTLVFDFGGAPVGAHVTISKIYLEEVVALSYDDANNLWKSVDNGDALKGITTWFADNNWSELGTQPKVSHNGKVWSLTVPENTGGLQWQGQVKIFTTLSAAQNNSYNFQCTITADNNIDGATIKLTQSDVSESEKHDDNFFFGDRHNITADEPFVYKALGVVLPKGDAHELTMVFDFGGSPVGTNIVISDIIFEKAE